MLAVEHISSYLIEIFRHYEVEKYGVVDVNGIPRAKYERILSAVQYFYACFLIGYIAQEIADFKLEECSSRVSLCLLWIMVDMVMMLATRLFLTLALYMKLNSQLI